MKRYQKLLIGLVIFGAGYLLGNHNLLPSVFGETIHPGNSEKYSLENCVKTMTESNMTQKKNGRQFWFVEKTFGKGLNLKCSEVGPKSARHPAHSHQAEEIFFILKGQAEFTLRDQHKTVPPNSSMYCPPGVLHGIRNAGDSPLRYLVIRMDPPAK